MAVNARAPGRDMMSLTAAIAASCFAGRESASVAGDRTHRRVARALDDPCASARRRVGQPAIPGRLRS